MAQRRCTYKHTPLMVARKDARTYHCTARATVRKADHYMQGRLRSWLCDDHAAQCDMPVVQIFVKGVIAPQAVR